MCSSSPIFIIGSYRSGTSIFAWCLGQHPNIVNLPETNWIYQYAVNLEQLYTLGTCNGKHSHLGQVGLTKDEFYSDMGRCVDGLIMDTVPRLDGYILGGNEVASERFRRRHSESDSKSRWVDATPENSHYIYGLSKMFPQAKFIHLVRNPEDVVRSLLKFSNAGGSDYSEIDAYETWYRLVSASISGEQALGSERVFRVLYDDLISQPENVIQKCLGFLSEKYDSRCIAPLEKRINSSKVDAEQVHTARIMMPSLKGIKKKSKELYAHLAATVDETIVIDEKALGSIKEHHEQ